MENRLKISTIDLPIFVMVAKIFMNCSQVIPSFQVLDNIFVIIYLICIIYLILKEKYTVRNLITISIISIFIFYSAVVTGYSDLLISYLFILAIRDCNFDLIIKHIYKFYVFFFILHIVLTITFSFTGTLTTSVFFRGVNRYTLGFTHPNTAGGKFFTLTLLYLWVYRNSIDIKRILVLINVNLIVYLLSDSRTAFILSILSIILFKIGSKKYVYLHIIINKIALIIFPFLSILIYIFILLYDKSNPIALIMNKLLTGRINLGAYALNRVGLTFFGRFIDFYGDLSQYSAMYGLNNFTFDCIYSFFFCNMGLIYIIILSLEFYFIAKRKTIYINICIILWSLYGVTEVSCLNVFNCYPIVFIVLLINSKGTLVINSEKKMRLYEN